MKIKSRITIAYIYFLRSAKKIKYTNRYYSDRKVNQRLSSYPYISGDTFRNISHTVLVAESKIGKIQSKSLFWDRSEISVNQLQKIINNIEKKQELILIIHNGDQELVESDAIMLKEKFSKIYSTNFLGKDSEIEAIPIGLENRYINMHGDYTKISKNYEKIKSKILVNFNPFTNENFRLPLLKYCLDHTDVFEIKVNINRQNYFRELGTYRFVLSPPGNGLDCHRTWEAIYCKTIPIVFRKCFPFSFDELPVLIIDQIEDLANIELRELDVLYQNILKKVDKKAYFKYWEDKMLQNNEYLN
jgi:hypothetical protein